MTQARHHPPRPPRLARLLLGLTVVLAAHASAQTAATDVALPSLLSNLTGAPDWRRADLTFLSAQQSLEAAQAAAGLNVSATASYTEVNLPGEGGARSWTGGGTVGASASANVLPWSSTQAQIVSARRALERAAFDRRDSRNTLALNVAQAYFTARLAAQDVTLAQGQLDLANQQLAVAQSQLALGQVPQDTVLARQEDQQNAQSSLDSASSTLNLDLRQLGQTLGRDLGAVALVSAPAQPSTPAPLDALLARAQVARSEVVKARSNLQDAQDALRVARLNRSLPDVSVSLNYGQLSNGTTSGTLLSGGLNLKSGAATASFSTPTGGSSLPTGASLGISGSYAIFDPSADASVRSYQTALGSATLALSTAQQTVDLDVRQKYADLQNALASLQAVQTSVSRAETALASAQAREAAGLATALDTRSAQLSLDSARRSRESALQTAYLASLRLANATGDFTPSLLGGQP